MFDDEVCGVLQVNLRAKQRASFKQATERKPESKVERDATSSHYHDPRISSLGSQRSRRQFKFIEPGEVQRKGCVCDLLVRLSSRKIFGLVGYRVVKYGWISCGKVRLDLMR